MLKSSLLLCLMCVLLVSCGNPGGSSNSKKVTTISELQVEFVMNNQNFECATIDGSNTCPEGLARLLVINKKNADKSYVCSGFMVDATTMVTNQHCIPDLKACRNTHIAIYNGYTYQKTRCEKIIRVMSDSSHSNDPQKKLDVSVVKVTTSFHGQFFQPALESARYGDKLKAWVMDHTGLEKEEPNLYDVRITEINCTFVPYRGVGSMVMERCPVIEGNSGSPLLNQDGKIVGVIWGGTGTKTSSLLDLNTRRSLKDFATATDIGYFRKYLPQ